MRERREKLADNFGYPPRLMRAERAAAYLDISTSHFLKLVEDQALPTPCKLGGVVAWDRLDLDAVVSDLKDQNTNTIDRLLEKKKSV